MKRLLSVLLALVMVFSLAACGAEPGGTGPGGKNSTETTGKDIGTLGEPKDDDTETETEDEDDYEPEVEVDSPPTSIPEPEDEPEEEPAPTEQTPEVELYECDKFSLYIPKGWKLDWYEQEMETRDQPFLYVRVVDPKNPHNMMFIHNYDFIVFETADDKETFMDTYPYANDFMQWAPVVSGGNAAGLFEQWGSLYTGIEIAGSYAPSLMDNYMVSEVLEVETSANDPFSVNLAAATIMGDATESEYGVLHRVWLQSAAAPYPLSMNIYTNILQMVGAVEESQFETVLPFLNQCLLTFSPKSSNSGSNYAAAPESSDGLSETALAEAMDEIF